jgi:hypothetical protein
VRSGSQKPLVVEFYHIAFTKSKDSAPENCSECGWGRERILTASPTQNVIYRIVDAAGGASGNGPVRLVGSRRFQWSPVAW